MTQAQALDILKLGYNVYLTGPAGSGKTHVLNTYIHYLKKHEIDVGITASTGIAATHMGGQTIHSWTGLGIKDALTDVDLDSLLDKKYLAKRMEKVRVLIIDEVSMLHDFRLDLIEEILRAFKGNSLPFGGIQVVLCGDFFQLPPVSRFGEPEARFVYHSSAWHKAKLKVCYLNEQYRHKNDKTISILNSIRANTVDADVRLELDKVHVSKKKKIGLEPTRLFTHNADVDDINNQALAEIPGEVARFDMLSHGSEFLVGLLKKSCLAPETLRLKKGARVMFVKNNFEEGYVNGTLGIVESLHGEFGNPIIRISRTNKLIEVERASWTIEEDGAKKAEINQYPLRLAWAITVHKSQGMSLDAVEVDLSKSFEPGMGYVALSRVRSIEGLTILGLNEQALKINEEVLEFDEELKVASENAVDKILSADQTVIKQKQAEYLKDISPIKKASDPKQPSHYVTLDLVQSGLTLADIAKKRGMTEETVISHLEKLADEDKKYLKDFSVIKKTIPHKTFEIISEAIEKKHDELGDWRLAPVKDYLDKNKKKLKLSSSVSYKEVQLVRLFIKPLSE